MSEPLEYQDIENITEGKKKKRGGNFAMILIIVVLVIAILIFLVLVILYWKKLVNLTANDDECPILYCADGTDLEAPILLPFPGA